MQLQIQIQTQMQTQTQTQTQIWFDNDSNVPIPTYPANFAKEMGVGVGGPTELFFLKLFPW